MSALYENLKRSLQDLAAPAADQVRSLRRQRVGPDELALELDAYGLAGANLVDTGELSQPVHAIVLELLGKFDEFGGQEHAQEWTEEALHTSPRWTEVRRLAAEALALMESP
jgi:hypothetical protein